MRSIFHWRASLILGASLLCPALFASTYMPMSDRDLAHAAPMIVRAAVVSQLSRLENVGGESRPFTIVTFQTLEVLKGSVGETFSVRLPGGKVGRTVWWVPGTPIFTPAGEVLLMLGDAPGHSGELRLTEFGLSKFDVMTDEAGRRFAVRPAFDAQEDLVASKRADLLAPAAASEAVAPRAPLARDAESFFSALRALASGAAMPEVAWAAPTGRFDRPGGLRRPDWVNIGGREPGGDCQGTACLFRWFWDTGGSPNAVVTVTGTQSNLRSDGSNPCGTDSVCDVQNGVDQWKGVAQTDVRLSGLSATGNIHVGLDATVSFDGTTWTTPIGCEGGTIGLGGPGSSSGPRAYRGDGNYYAPSDGDVSMRKVTCTSGYPARLFRSAVLHELGHTLGLGHPDDPQVGESVHSTTVQADWDAAVMHSQIPDAGPDTPQRDDIQAIQYLYGTAAVGARPAADFSFGPGAPTTSTPVSFNDASANAPTGWAWNFGDPASGANNVSAARNPSHVYGAAGTYTVTLIAGNLNGSGTISKTVTVGSGAGVCVPSGTTLCLNNGRFQVTASWQRNDGSAGNGSAVPLTADSGYFWFFNSANIEVVLKVLNACVVANNYWIFAAGLTNVKVTLIVVDTSNGASRSYVNPLGTAFAPIQDTSAFATCP